jgi:probable addiction module antidote protein
MSRPNAFDAADYLDSEEVIAEYLNLALASEHPELLLQAVADVAKARGMAQLAKDTGLGRESLYKALAPGAKPRYDTVLKIIRALGVQLHTSPVANKA